MKRIGFFRLALAVLVAVVIGAPMGWAQRRPGLGRGMPRYDPSTEVTVKGTVEEVTEIAGPMGRSGTHLTLKAENKTVDVHLGPSDFLAQNKWQFAKGDEIEVTGSKVKYEGAEALVAREVKKGDKTLTLRNAQGIPQWFRGRRRY